MIQISVVQLVCEAYNNDQNSFISPCSSCAHQAQTIKLKLHETMVLFPINHSNWLDAGASFFIIRAVIFWSRAKSYIFGL